MHGPPSTRTDTRPIPAVRFGTRMLRRFGWFYRLLGFGRAMGRIRFEDHSVEEIRRAAEKGPLVYVLARRSTIDHLALNTVLARRRLPLSLWANGATSFFWQPVAQAWADVARRVRAWFHEGPFPDPVTSGWVARTVAHGGTVTVFVDDEPGLLDRLRPRWRRSSGDALAALLEAQAFTDRPIQLVPIVVVWNRSPQWRYDTVRGFLQETLRPTNFLTQLLGVWFRSGEAFVQAGTPLDLQELRQRVEPARQVRALRTVLRRYLRRESRLVRGPVLLEHADMKRLVLDNPPMRELARQEAAALGISEAQVRRRMEREYDRIAARFQWWVIRLLHLVLRPIWTRVFSGVDVTPEDLDRIRAAMRAGTAILVPSHKSHFDYVLLSWVFFAHDLVVPHVVAGMNLALWPISILLRGGGGFFIKRRFDGDRIFAAVFSRYLRELVRHGYPIEFFIEGGRTRTGKLLRPRLGVLGMVFEAAERRPRGREVTILPIALAYEQVAEEAAYASELRGEEKQAESVGQLVRARWVLRRRYGRVYLRVGEPLEVSSIVDPTDDRPAWSQRPPEVARDELRRAGERVVHWIGRVVVVLPTSIVALALLCRWERGLAHDDLLERCHRFRALLLARGAPESASLAHPDPAFAQALERFQRAGHVRHFDEDGHVWSVVPERRLTLDFYKNQVLHHLATGCLAAAAVYALPDAPFDENDVLPNFELLTRVFRREFVLDPDATTAELLRDGLDVLEGHGAVARADGRFALVDRQRLGELQGLVASLLESYALVLRATESARIPDAKTFVEALQSRREGLFATQAITRPEALSADSLRNALDTFVDEGVLRRTEQGMVPDPEARRLLWTRLEPMVD